MAEAIETTESVKKQYIVVKIGSEQYGIDISYVDKYRPYAEDHKSAEGTDLFQRNHQPSW